MDQYLYMNRILLGASRELIDADQDNSILDTQIDPDLLPGGETYFRKFDTARQRVGIEGVTSQVKWVNGFLERLGRVKIDEYALTRHIVKWAKTRN